MFAVGGFNGPGWGLGLGSKGSSWVVQTLLGIEHTRYFVWCPKQ